DAEEGVVSRRLEDPGVDARLALERARAWLGAIFVLKVGEGQRHPGRNPGSRPNRRRAEAVRLEQVVDRALSPLAVIGVAGRVDAQDPPARAHALWLVDGAGVTDAVAQRLRRAVT